MRLSLKNKFGLMQSFAVFATLTFFGCAGGDSKKDDENIKSTEGTGSGSSGEGDDAKDEESGKPASYYAASNRTTMVNSLSNNSLTSYTVSDGKAEGLAAKFAGGKDKKSLESKISAERLARKSVSQVMADAKKLAELEMEKSAGRSISEDVKLEVALAAIGSKNYSLAEYYLQDLTSSKDAKARAGAYNALGVIALKDDRVPEAVLYFKEALKANGNYKPALLNLGFVALKGGDTAVAKKALDSMQSDWFVQYGMITVARLEGNESKASEACDRVLKQEAGHKPALFNCALLEYQNKKNLDKAKDLVGKASKAKGGESGWDSRVNDLSNRIDFDLAEGKSKDAKEKAKKASTGAGGK